MFGLNFRVLAKMMSFSVSWVLGLAFMPLRNAISTEFDAFIGLLYIISIARVSEICGKRMEQEWGCLEQQCLCKDFIFFAKPCSV